MRRRRQGEAHVEFVDVRRRGLVRTAHLLCGDGTGAEDLVQQALVKLYATWPTVTGQVERTRTYAGSWSTLTWTTGAGGAA